MVDAKVSDPSQHSQKRNSLDTRDSCDSTPQMSDSDDNNNEIAVQGFERFRENSASSVEDTTKKPPLRKKSDPSSAAKGEASSSTTTTTTTTAPLSPLPPNDSIAEYCAESLYSYSFTPLSRVHKAAKIKRQILSRGMDYMQRIRWKTGERDTGRRFSQPDIGVLDKTNDWVDSANELPRLTKPHPHHPSVLISNVALSSPTSPLTASTSSSASGKHPAHFHSPLNPSFEQPIHRSNGFISPTTSPTMSSPIPTTSSRQRNRSNLLHTHFCNEEEDDNDFNLGRRQTIEVYNNLPPIYERPDAPDAVAAAAAAAAAAATTTTSTASTGATTTTTAEVFPGSIQYSRALHAPSRFLPQNQAILTTDADATILLFNDMASLCFGIDKMYIGKCILTLLKEPFKKQIGSIIQRRRDPLSPSSTITTAMTNNKGHVLVCGVVVPIVKMTGESSAASLWLKEKKTDEGKSIYIWIFEEIYEISLSFQLDDDGIVRDINGKAKDLFGYDSDEIIGEPITKLIPALSSSSNANNNTGVTIPTTPIINLQQKTDSDKFFGGRSKLGICFPLMVNPSASTPNKIKIYSSPSIAGMINVHQDSGKIQSINPVPAKYLFGYAPDALVEKFNIDQLIPQFSNIVGGLRRCHLLQYSCTVNNHACRWVISDFCAVDKYKSMEVNKSLKSLERQPSVSSNGQTLPTIYATHRDGSQFEVHLQLRLIKSDQEDIITVWVTFDRIHSLRKAKRAAQIQQAKQKFQFNNTNTANINNNAATAPTTTTTTPVNTLISDDLSHPLSPSNPSASLRQQQQEKIPPPIETTLVDEDPATPIPTFNKIDYLGQPINNNVNTDTHNNITRTQDDVNSEPKPEEPKRRPPVRPYGIASFGAVDQNKALFPEGIQDRKRRTSKSTTDMRQLSLKPDEAQQLQSKPPPDTPQHPLDAYQIIGTLGEGAYGTAKLAYRKDDPTQTKVVIKCIAKSRIIVDSWIRDRQLGLIPLEIHILKKLKEHPQANCCALETYMEDEDTYYVVMKLYGVSSMDLFDYIELNEHIKEDEIRNIFRQVALAVDHIQSLRIVHRDIKDENILLDETGCVHLIDFGSAAYFRKGRTFDTFGGTLDYCAPEILKGMPYEGPPQDIWSLGTLLYTLIYRENPFYNVDEILEHDLRIPYVLSEGSLELVKKMLNRDVEHRYTIKEVLAHPWLNVNSDSNNENNEPSTQDDAVHSIDNKA